MTDRTDPRTEQPVIGHVVPIGDDDPDYVTVCADCVDDPEDSEGTIRDDPIYGDEVAYPECHECGEVMRPEVTDGAA